MGPRRIVRIGLVGFLFLYSIFLFISLDRSVVRSLARLELFSLRLHFSVAGRLPRGGWPSVETKFGVCLIPRSSAPVGARAGGITTEIDER